jgi:hypothetical protein
MTRSIADRRAACKTFRPGDRVTVRRVVKSGKYPEYRLVPGMTGTVERMGQRVEVVFPEYPRALWMLYDGDLILATQTGS